MQQANSGLTIAKIKAAAAILDANELTMDEQLGEITNFMGFTFIQTKREPRFNVEAWAKRFGVQYLPATKEQN